MTEWFDNLIAHDFASFIGKAMSSVQPGVEYLPNWHVELIAEHLEAVRRAQITRLVINMPPRALKSVCVSVAWPAWLLGHDPGTRIIAASYAASLATKHSLDCRQVLSAAWYKRIFPQTALTRDQNEKHKFMTTERGYRYATSVGGSVMGEGGNFLIIDDPISPLQARNVHWRNYVSQWFEHTFASRLDDKRNGGIVLVMQRLHEHDLSGYLLQKGGWAHLCLPAIALEEQVFDFGGVRKVRGCGEALHPQREDVALLERTMTELGSAAFSAQYQQRPLPEEGSMLKAHWLRRYTALPPTIERCVQSWDTAIKSGQQHDASACLTFAEAEGKTYLVDACVFRKEYPDLKRQFHALAERWKPHAILVEDRASGQQLIQDVKRESALPVIPVSPKNDKVTRFAAVSAMIEAGKLWLPAEASWLADFENEILAFPSGGHDDQVDALTQYLDWLRASVWERFRIRRL